MGYTQVRVFDTGKGGHVPNLCLDNVRRGFGISNKYGSAWEAWQHTEQHPNRDVPSGLDVPLYYSYTATLDGVTQNYGHINVQLSNGQVWSDGKLYASIDAYTANHYPKFVGWGESVNDFKVIQEGGNMPYVDQAVLDDYEGWKKMGIFLSNQPAYPAMGGKAGEWLRDPSGIKIVLDDYEKVKQGAQASYEEINEKLYRRK